MSELSKFQTAINQIDQFDNYDPSLTEKIGVGSILAYIMAKNTVFRNVDTLGFGNVEGSYGSEPKPLQAVSNLTNVGGGKRRNLPFQIAKQAAGIGMPSELESMEESLRRTEEYMSKLKSAGKRVPKKVTEYYNNLLNMRPDRYNAQAILQRSGNMPINFKYTGKFTEGGYPQNDPIMRKAMINKGLNTNVPIPHYDLTSDKKVMSRLRRTATNDPRMRVIHDLLKQGKVKEAKIAARQGLMYTSGKRLGVAKNTKSKIKLMRTPTGWQVQYVPHQSFGRGILTPVKDYVIGGHTNVINYERMRDGKLYRTTGRILDLTTYASAGETVAKSKTIGQKARVLFAGRLGQTLGIHEPVITTGNLKYRKPGGGRKPKTTSTYKKTGKFVEASVTTPYQNKAIEDLLKSNKKKAFMKSLGTIFKAIATKGRRF